MDTYAGFIENSDGLRLLRKTTSIEDGVALSASLRPDITIIDAEYPSTTTLRFAKIFLSHSANASLLIIDRLPREAYFIEVIPYQQISYLTRSISSVEFTEAVFSAASGRRFLDTSIKDQIVEKSGMYKFIPKPGEASLSSLTPRERDIFQLLAEGLTVKDAASRLDLAHSTVDNHKWRAMRKLKVHRTSDLTRIAIKFGLIDP